MSALEYIVMHVTIDDNGVRMKSEAESEPHFFVPSDVFPWNARSQIARDFQSAKAKGDKFSFLQFDERLIDMEMEQMRALAWVMLDVVCGNGTIGAPLTPNHRLRDFAVAKFRYHELHRLHSEAWCMKYEDAHALFDKMYALFDKSPAGFIDFWDTLQKRLAISVWEEVSAAREALCSPGEDMSGERLVQWQNMTQVDRAVVLKQAREKRWDGASKPSLNEAITIKQDFRDQDPSRVSEVFKQTMQQVPTSPRTHVVNTPRVHANDHPSYVGVRIEDNPFTEPTEQQIEDVRSYYGGKLRKG